MIRKLFCNHQWRLLSEVKEESPYVKCNLKKIEGSLSELYGTLVQLACCDKCGKIKKFVEKI